MVPAPAPLLQARCQAQGWEHTRPARVLTPGLAVGSGPHLLLKDKETSKSPTTSSSHSGGNRLRPSGRGTNSPENVCELSPRSSISKPHLGK